MRGEIFFIDIIVILQTHISFHFWTTPIFRVEFTNLFHVSCLVFLKTLCLTTFLRWNALSLIVFVGSLWCFLYSALTILFFFSHSSFHYATVGLLFVSEDVLGMVFSAACSIVLTRQLCTSSIEVWFCTFFVIVIYFWNCVQFAFPILNLCCCFMETSLSSSMMMGKWSLALSSYSLFHSSSVAIIRLVIVRSIVNLLLSNTVK